MATRFYPSTTTRTRPTIRATWGSTSVAAALATDFFTSAVAKTDPNIMGTNYTKTSSTNPFSVLCKVFVLPAFAAEFSISSGCTLSTGIPYGESSANANAYACAHLYVMNSDGTVAATLNSTTMTTLGGGELNTASGREITGIALADGVTCAVGTRIVMEFGARLSTSGTTYSATEFFKGAQASDYNATDNDVTWNAWIEFSDTFASYLSESVASGRPEMTLNTKMWG
jgi:hypothetical protein